MASILGQLLRDEFGAMRGGFGEVQVGSANPLGQVRPVNDGRGERLGQLRRDWFCKWRDEFSEYSRAALVGRVGRVVPGGFGEATQASRQVRPVNDAGRERNGVLFQKPEGFHFEKMGFCFRVDLVWIVSFVYNLTLKDRIVFW